MDMGMSKWRESRWSHSESNISMLYRTCKLTVADADTDTAKPTKPVPIVLYSRTAMGLK